MPESIEDIIEEAKKQKSRGMFQEALQNMRAEGVLTDEPSSNMDNSAFAKSAVKIADASHDARTENVQQTHSNIDKSIISPVIEIALIQEAAKKENDAFKRLHTVDDLTQQENDIIVKEIEEAHTDILQLLVSLQARGRDDAREDLRSLVSGEQARLAAAGLGINPLPGTPGFFGKLKKIVSGGK